MTEEKKPARVDPFHRPPQGAFTSLEREKYAKARAKGESIKQASESAGISPATGTSYEKHEAMRQRISELREGAETFVGVSTGWIVTQLMINAQEARETGAIKSSNEALMAIYKVMNENRGMAGEMARALPPSVTPADLKKELSARFSPKALPKPAYVVPEAPKEDDEAAE